MKTQFLAAAALVAVLAAPAFAHAQDGYLDLGYRTLDNGSVPGDIDGVSIGGGLATDVGGLKLQLNGNHVRLNTGAGSNTSASDFTAHLYKQTETYAVGGFASATDAGGDGVYGIGAEGQLYIGRVTLGALVSYNDADNGGGQFYDFGAQARIFATDNLSFAAVYDRIDYKDFGDANVWAAEVEWKTNSPVSLFGSYGRVDGADGGVDYDKISAGARWTFGGKSLKDQERSGAKAQRAMSAAAKLAF